jgi:hypothetical protein
MHKSEDGGTVRTTTPLLEKVARGAHLPARENSNTAAYDFTAQAMDPAGFSDRLEQTTALSGEHADLKHDDFAENSTNTSNAGVGASLIAGIPVEARHALHGAERQNDTERRKEEFPSAAADNNFDHTKGSVIDEQHSKAELKSVGSVNGDPAPRETKEIERKGLETNQAGSRQMAAENEWSIKEAFLIARQDGEPEEKGFLTPQDHDFRSEHDETRLIARQAGAPGEKRIPTLQGRDFRQGFEKLKREKRDTNDALKAIFPRENLAQAQEKDKQFPAERIMKHAENEEKVKTIPAADIDRHNYSIAREPRDNEPPLKTITSGEALPRQEKQRERNKTFPIAEKATYGQDKSIGAALDVDSPASNKPVIRDAYPTRNQELPVKQPSTRQQGTVRIGNINIHIKGRDKTEREAAWPEAPSYVDHAITEDWEWSCRYGR